MERINPDDLRPYQSAQPLHDSHGRPLRTFPKTWESRPSSDPAPTAGATCPTCRGAGFLVADVPLGHPQFGQLQRCACRVSAAEAERAAERAAQHAGALERLSSELGRLRDRTWDTFDLERPLDAWAVWEQNGNARYSAAQQRYALRVAAGHVRAYSEAPSAWLYLQGPYGSGKSHLAAAVAHVAAARDVLVSYASTPKLLQFIRQGFKDRSADDRIEALQEVPLLVLDDIGTEQVTGWSAETLFNLLHERYNHERPTILTSNVPIEQVGGRLGSRIAELADVVTVVASDYRLLRLQQAS